MKVKIVKVSAKKEQALWHLSPVVSRSEDECFSIIKRTYLWFNNAIIGYRYTMNKKPNVGFSADRLDFSELFKD